MDVALLALVMVAVTACAPASARPLSSDDRGTGGVASSPGLAPSIAYPCVGSAAPNTYAHVIVFWMQDKTPLDLANRDARFLTRLGDACGVATNAHWVWHPTFQALTSGDARALRSGCDAPGPGGCSLASESIFSATKSAGLTWRAYVEDMPEPCAVRTTNLYSPAHNPPIWYSGLAADCAAWDVAMGTTSAGSFAADLDADRLAGFIWITPNLCHDMHDCGVSQGDAWLEAWITRIVRSKAYLDGGTAIFITWDDSGTDPGDGKDCTNSDDPVCRVPLIVVSPSTIPGARSAESFSHYSLLRTCQELLGLPRLLGGAATAASLRRAFHL